MSALIYSNTKNLPSSNFVNIHRSFPIGISYTYNNYFVHLYGKNSGLWHLPTDLVIRQKENNISHNDWINEKFGAENIKQSHHNVGEVVAGVWRPGLYYQNLILQALNSNEYEQRSAELTLKSLISKLDELLSYIEPSQHGLLTYSHKTRELLILACTEVENIWQRYMKIAGAKPTRNKNFCTLDYVKLLKPLFLAEYQIKVKPYPGISVIEPFGQWSTGAPSQSLAWYEAYNLTKHDRDTHFDKATLLNCIHAITANIVLFCVRFSPNPLLFASTPLSDLINQFFEITLNNPDPASFYIPKYDFSNESSGNTGSKSGEAGGYILPWTSKKLVL